MPDEIDDEDVQAGEALDKAAHYRDEFLQWTQAIKALGDGWVNLDPAVKKEFQEMASATARMAHKHLTNARTLRKK